MYEIILVETESEFLKEVAYLKYSLDQNLNSKTNNELFTVKFRYKKPSKAISIATVHVQKYEVVVVASNDFKFASAVTLFDMKLRKSQYVKNIEKEAIIKLAENGRGEDQNGYRAEFIRLVKSI